MNQPLAVMNPNGQARMAGDHAEDYSREPSTGEAFSEEEDDECGEDNLEGESANPSGKASLTAKLHEMERDVAALKRVLSIM